jgi:hypothetical protein
MRGILFFLLFCTLYWLFRRSPTTVLKQQCEYHHILSISYNRVSSKCMHVKTFDLDRHRPICYLYRWRKNICKDIYSIYKTKTKCEMKCQFCMYLTVCSNNALSSTLCFIKFNLQVVSLPIYVFFSILPLCLCHCLSISLSLYFRSLWNTSQTFDTANTNYW